MDILTCKDIREHIAVTDDRRRGVITRRLYSKYYFWHNYVIINGRKFPIFLLFLQVGYLILGLIRKTLKILWLIFIAFALMILAGALVIQVPQVQTAIVTKVTDSLSEKLDGDISIEKIHFKPFSTLVLKNLVITDKNPLICPTDSTLAQIDTFFRSEYVIVKLSLAGLLDEESIKIRSAVVRNAQMNLVLEDLMSEADTVIMYNNLSRIFRIDKDKERKEPRPDEIFRIKDVKIEDMGFVMKNYSTRPIKRLGGGIDWNDLNIHDICVNARDLAFKNGIMSGKADKISFREETGFVVSSMSGEARVGRGRSLR